MNTKVLKDTLTQLRREDASERTLATDVAEHLQALANRQDTAAEAI